MRADVQELELLASWLQQHGHIVSTLKVWGARYKGADWAAAWNAVALAFQAAGATAPPPAAKAAAPGSRRWQLQSFSADVGASATAAALQQLLQHLPAYSLTQLGCYLGLADAGQVQAAPLSGLSRLTGLCSLHLIVGRGAQQQPHELLDPLSALRQLTELQLQAGLVRRVQLQHLQLPRLQQLAANVGSESIEGADQLQLTHLTALTQLLLLECLGSTCVLAPAEQLPPNLRCSVCTMVRTLPAAAAAAAAASSHCCYSDGCRRCACTCVVEHQQQPSLQH